MQNFVKVQVDGDSAVQLLNPAHIVSVVAVGDEGIKRFTLSNNVAVVGRDVTDEATDGQ